uniref:Late embryogenesis abundant protein LEA-2 subgroup domain-containing protein n=1 Tax=Salix viminalis TaxID=40686 RepID=A0A6N2KDP8_SALVM
MAEKQGLNGAYYGPAIPPPRHYHRPGRGSSCCGCCCLVTFLLKVIFTVLALVGLFLLVVWLIFRPINKVKLHVTDVALTEFNHTNNMLRYNLTFNLGKVKTTRFKPKIECDDLKIPLNGLSSAGSSGKCDIKF